MRTFASILAGAACLVAVPALAAPEAGPQKPLVLAGAEFCVGPACVGHDDRDWRYRRHYGYDYDTDHCRDVTIRHRRSDGDVVVRHERHCD